MLAQADANDLSIVIGDEAFLGSQDKVPVKEMANLGKGELYFITNAEIKDISEIGTLAKLAIPQSAKTIYGGAAAEYIANAGIKSEIIEVASVPQVSTYVISGDVDGGFVNATEAAALAGKVRTALLISEGYKPIKIVAARLEACDREAACERFLEILQSEKSQEIFAKFGLKK